jgi:hypothetical protein
VDTENGRASLYSHLVTFDVLELRPPFHTDKYIVALNGAAAAGYDVVVLDSITPQWDGEGGILDRKGQLDKRGGNSYTNWADFTVEHNRFRQAIVQAKPHVIATMRSKQDYVLMQNANGKQEPRKVGLAPIQREGFEYEFPLVFDVQMDHRAKASKDNSGLFGDQLWDLADPKVGQMLNEWLKGAVDAGSVAR